MVRERRGKKSKSKDVEEAPPAPVLLEVPEPAINRFFKREKSPFEVGDKKELQVASSNAIIDKACVMDISGGAAQVAAKVDEYINLLFTDYCALDQASCGDISKEIKIVVIEEEGDLASIQPALSVEEEEKQRQEAEEAARIAAEEEAKRRAQEEQRAREQAERLAREEEERIAREEAERIAAEEAEKLRLEEEKQKAAEEEKRKKAEAEAKKKAEEEEKAKKEAEEKARLEAEAEAARKKAEEEAYDSDRELIPPKEDDGIDWAAVEEEAPLVPDVLQELLEQRATEDEEETAEESEKEMTERDRDLEWQRQRQMMRPPLVISHLKSRAVPIGSTAKLTCNVTGPSLSVRWLKNGNPVELKPEKYKFFNSEGLLSLEILNVSKRDAGEYTCFAKNKNGETSTIASVTVYDTDVERPIPPTFITIKDRSKVDEPPKEVEEKIELDKWGDPIKKRKRKVRPLSLWAQREKLEFTVHLPATLTVIEDRNARFICGVSGGGDLEITWYKNDRKIRFERFPRILDYTRNSTGCIGIECSQIADAGTYKCTFTDKEKGETLTTQCELIVVPRIKRTKELSRKIPPAFVRKLQYTYKPEDDQLIVHCTILANPEPSIKWYVQKVPLHLCPLPRVTVFNHPDDVHEHTIASLVILGPSYLDNGEYVIEVENDAGFERRTLNIQFQTEEEYNEKYYQRYLEHKEHFKLHEYGPGEERWEDIVPEVKEFHFYEPEPEVGVKKVSAGGKTRMRRKKHRLIKKKMMMPWGEEEEHEVTDEDASSESYTGSESEAVASEPEEKEDWGVESEPEEEPQPAVEEHIEAEPQSEIVEEQKEPQTDIVEEQKEPESVPEIVEEQKLPEPEPEIVEEQKLPEPEPEIVEEQKVPEPEPEPVIEPIPESLSSAEIQTGNIELDEPSYRPPEFEDFEPKNRDYEPEVVRMRQEDPEFPYIWKRPKFYITDFQLRKKFYFVNKLIDVELVKGKTLRLESFAAALGKVTVEWRFNGRIIGETHRRTIEFNPHRNLTVLEIENTRVQDSGTYSVVFYNDFTEPLIDACKVNIIVPKPLETADQPPTFTRLITDTYKDWTDELILDCHVRGIPKPTVTWYKNGNEVPTDNPRYHFEHDDDGNCTFTIINPIKNADRGRYVVKAKNHVGEDECQLRVWFRGKEDDDMHERAEYRRTQKMYKSRHVKEKDEDEWGGELYHSKRLDKQKDYDHRYKLSWLSRITAQTLAQGSSLKFVAFVDGKYPQFEWYFNDIPLVHGRKYRQIVTKNGKGCLIINNVQPMDSGIYRLVVKNYANSIDCEAKVTIYAYEHKNFEPPLFLNTLAESYNLYNDLLTLECRVRGTPKPHIQWMKDGDYIMPGDKYQQTELPDGTCKLIIQSPDPEEDSGTYTCEAECNGCSDSISHNVQYEGSVENQFNRVHRYYHRDPLKPYFKTGLVDTNVPSGGSIALFVESQANCEAEWYRDRWIVDHKPPKRYIFNDGSGFFACVINHATMDEAAKYSCKLSNPYGTSQSTSFIDVINPNQVGKGQKPPIFLTRPQPEIKIRAGDPFSMSFRVQGEPKPRIQWYKGARDITNAGRTIKEVFNDYVRFSIKESKENDSGIYFITARNRHGVDRSFCQVTVRERQELSSSDAAKLSNIDFTDVSYMKNPPGQIPNEPTVIDSSANHLSLSWMKPQCNDAAPVVGYRIDVWLVGKEGDATWKEIGTSGLASFDVFNLKHGCEYHFRVTPRNRYGYGPSTQTTYPVMFGDVVKLPEFTKILPGQLKALINDDITLECVSMGSPRPDIVWYKDGIRIDSNEKHVISVMGPLCRLIIRNVTENDNGRYTCEASNKEGRVSTFARVQTVTDPKLLEADNKLKKNIETDLEQLSVGDEILPQFTMRLRDRRVQCTYPVRLTCQALAVPHATIEWFKEGIKLIEDDRIAFLQENQFSTLEFSRTYLEDSGQYTVTARNELGSVSCHCNLTVDKGIRAYISPEFIKPLDIVCTYNEGQDIHLEAHVEAYPSVGVTWHHNGIRLRPSRKIQASLDCDGIVSLIITETTVKDAGTYTCVASNAVGRVESTCRINIIENSDKKSRVIPSIVAPDAPYSKEPLFLIRPRSSEAFEGDTVIIMCEVIGDPKPEVLWLRDFLKPEYYKDAQHFRSVIGNESEYRLEIPHAKIEYTGTYSVIASNCYGQAKAIISLQIYAKDLGRSMDAGSIIHGNIETLPRIVKHLKDLRCCDGDAITLECHVEGTPEPNVFWEKDGKILHDRSTEHRQNFNGHKATLSIQRVFPEDEGQYCLVACNNMGRVKSFACIIVDVPEEKENLLSRQLSRPMTFLSPNSTPRSTPRSTPARSMSPFSLHLSMITNNAHLSYRQRRYRFSAPKFYSVPHNRVCEEGDTVRFQCAIAGHPIPWSTWDKDGVIVTPSQRHIIKERDDMRYLEIEEVCFEDAGLYRITLENEYGRIEATARLDIIKSNKVNRRGIRASSAPNRDSRSISRRIMGYSTKIGGRMALAGQRASSIPAKKTVYHDGYDITDCERLTITENENEILIEIDTVKTYDEGEYTLMLEDEDGIITTTTTFAKVHYVDDEIFREKIPPKIKHHLINNVTSIEGIPLDLTLHLDCKIPFDYVWFKNNEPIINSDDFIYIDHGNGILTLRIQDPFVFDSGKYSCVITTLSGECTSECDVEIEELYEINVLDVIPEFIKAPLPFISLPGCLASFCARITPVDSEVIWSVCGCEINDDMKDYKIERLEDGLNVLHVLNVDHRQSGEIKCLVISCNNPKIFNVYHTSLTVLPVPISERYEPIESVLENNCNNNNKSNKSSEAHDLDLSCFITKRPEDRTVLVGDSIELNVSYIGYPDPKVHWMRAERLIENQPNTIIITKNGHSRLIINNITSDQSGKYSVEIMNEHSTDIASASVAVEGVPDAPVSLSFSKGSDRIAVAWSGPPYDGGCMLTGFLLEMQHDNGEWKEVAKIVDSLAYTVKNLVHDVKYRFRVRAQNIHGSSAPSKSTEEIILVKPIDMDSEEGDETYSSVPQIKTGGDFKTRFDILEELGKGRFGTVYRVMERETRLILAAKIIKCIKAMDRKKVQDEIKIMKSLQHPKLLQLSASFETQKEIIMVMEYLCGGELFERVVADDFTLTERDCILFMRQICEGVEYMHSKYVVHLDLKPENIMCITRTSHQIKIIDFGLAQNLEPGKQVRVLFGTPEFCPPEIINYEPIGLQSDMWSLGVICYVLLSGLSPFMGENDVDTFSNITRAYYDFDDEAFDTITEEAKDFIAGLLVYRKENRMNAKQCLESKWLSQHYDVMGSIKLCTDKLKKFIIRRKWQKTGNAIRAIGKMKNLTLSAASRKSAGGVYGSPRPSLSGPTNNNSNSINIHNYVSDKRITSVNEEAENVSTNLLCANDKSKDPRVCNERSDSGFSECSSCSTPSASCVCNLTAHVQDTIIEEHSNSTSSCSSIELHETTDSTQHQIDAAEEIHTISSDHDIRSEISSLEYDEANKTNCDNNENIIDISIRVPTRRELFQNDDGDLMSEIERRKVSLENIVTKKSSPSKIREEFSLEKLKKTNKVAKLMEKYETPDESTNLMSGQINLPNYKLKSSVTNEKGLKYVTTPDNSNTNPPLPAMHIINRVNMCDLPKQDSINARFDNNHNLPPDSPLAKSPPSPTTDTQTLLSFSPATRKSTSSLSTNPTTTFRLSDRVREATERLSKPKQQAVTMTTDKTTKASILKQNANFVRSKEFWRR